MINIKEVVALNNYLGKNLVKKDGVIDLEATVERFKNKTLKYNEAYRDKEKEILDLCDLDLRDLNEDVTISLDKLCASIAYQESKDVDKIDERKEFVKSVLLKHSSSERCNPARYFRKVRGKGSGLCLWANKLAL
jgi:hypothetical protein